MKGIFTERNIVFVLFIMVMISFSLAQKETQKMERLYYGVTIKTGFTLASNILSYSPPSTKALLP
jgi:hypothetical protein